MDKPSGIWGYVLHAIGALREYNRIAGIAEITRRYLAMNAFDGVLTMIGVITGSYIAGIRSAEMVIHTGVATSIAMGVSGLWGAYLTETAERKRDLIELERATLADLSQTKIGRASRLAAAVVALADGLAPFAASLVVLVPFFAAPLLGSIVVSYAVASALALACLFGLGMFLGHISRRNLVGYGVRTLIAGIVSIALSLLLGAKP